MSMDDEKMPVGKTQKQRDSFVSQALGARMAVLAILPLTKSKKVRKACFEIGRHADQLVIANGGYVMQLFENTAKSLGIVE